MHVALLALFAFNPAHAQPPDECWMISTYNLKPPKAPHSPALFASRGDEAEECADKITRVCKELCEGGQLYEPGECSCGPVLYEKPKMEWDG